jgi:circadian clock protein KaiB
MTTICLRLVVTGQTISAKRARAALAELESRLIAERGPGAVVSEVVDVLAMPDIAARDDIFATPTIVRLSPGPSLRVFGDLSSADQLMTSLELALPPQVGTASVA